VDSQQDVASTDSLRTPEGKAEFEGRIKALGISGDPTDDEIQLGLPHFDYGRDLAFAPSLTLSPLEAWRVLVSCALNSLRNCRMGYGERWAAEGPFGTVG
jgi:hypothetical protein